MSLATCSDHFVNSVAGEMC